MGLFSRKKEVEKMVAPVTGEMIPMEEVADPVFSQKVLGDGVAFKPEGNLVVSPVSGSLETVFPTGHAFGVKAGEREILIHIGINTVELNGEGFKILKEAGNKVKAGEPVIELDLGKLKNTPYDMTTMLIITAGGEVSFADKHKVTAGEAIEA